MYLAWSLQRSKAVDGCRAVVGVVSVAERASCSRMPGVHCCARWMPTGAAAAHSATPQVGKGHLRGVAWALGTSKGGSLRFQDLVGQRGKGGRAERRARAAWRLALDTALFSALYAGWVAWTGQ